MYTDLMSNTETSTAAQIAAAEETLDRLTELGTDAKLRFIKRHFGGYYVEFDGLEIGWVVRSYSTKCWDAYFSGVEAGKGTRTGSDYRLREFAARELARNVSKPSRHLWSDRREYLDGLEMRLADEKRIARIMGA